MTTPLRKGLPPMPARMRSLPVDKRGYPVPFFVAWVDGEPDFRAMDGRRMRTCIEQHRCWLCGHPLGRAFVFVAGPMCGVNRVSSEPPSHVDCAEFAVKACPFLTLPKAQRRDVNMPDGAREPGGIMITRNPGVALIWTTRSYKKERWPNGLLFRMGEPTAISFWAEGRAATRAEIDESIRTGLPALESMCDGAVDRLVLQRMTQQFRDIVDQAVPA